MIGPQTGRCPDQTIDALGGGGVQKAPRQSECTVGVAAHSADPMKKGLDLTDRITETRIGSMAFAPREDSDAV
jgi:hypothetical protein